MNGWQDFGEAERPASSILSSKIFHHLYLAQLFLLLPYFPSPALAQTEVHISTAFPVLSWIQELQHENANVREEAAKKLGLWMFGNREEGKALKPAVVKALIPVLKDKEFAVRKAAATSLGHLQDPSAIGSLIDALKKEENSEVQNRIVGALSNIQDPRLVEFWLAALKNKEHRVHKRATHALINLTRQNHGEDYAQWQKWWKKNKNKREWQGVYSTTVKRRSNPWLHPTTFLFIYVPTAIIGFFFCRPVIYLNGKWGPLIHLVWTDIRTDSSTALWWSAVFAAAVIGTWFPGIIIFAMPSAAARPLSDIDINLFSLWKNERIFIMALPSAIFAGLAASITGTCLLYKGTRTPIRPVIGRMARLGVAIIVTGYCPLLLGPYVGIFILVTLGYLTPIICVIRAVWWTHYFSQIRRDAEMKT